MVFFDIFDLLFIYIGLHDIILLNILCYRQLEFLLFHYIRFIIQDHGSLLNKDVKGLTMRYTCEMD